jgi:ketosteroid isomerase-like protein
MADAVVDELLALNGRLLACIALKDWATYQELVDPTLTAFEPEGKGQLLEGMEFHRWYFNLAGNPGHHNTTMCSPRVRVMGDVAIVAYVRLNQRIGPDGRPSETAVEETRIWQKQKGAWKHVHFHRSVPG